MAVAMHSQPSRVASSTMSGCLFNPNWNHDREGLRIGEESGYPVEREVALIL